MDFMFQLSKDEFGILRSQIVTSRRGGRRRNRNTVEFLGIWERINNPDFNPVEFEGFKKEADLNGFGLAPKKWIEATNAVGLISKAGRYGGGTFAHKDIAFEFGSWHRLLFLHSQPAYEKIVVGSKIGKRQPTSCSLPAK
jgi:KilA-N domain